MVSDEIGYDTEIGWRDDKREPSYFPFIKGAESQSRSSHDNPHLAIMRACILSAGWSDNQADTIMDMIFQE